jgi:hypothetical protein
VSRAARDCAEALAARQPDPPARLDPGPVLLVVDRHHPLRSARLGQECIETVERAHIEHAHAGEVARYGGHAVAVIAGSARGVDPLLTVQSEGVEPERNSAQDLPGVGGVGLYRQQVGDFPLDGRHRDPAADSSGSEGSAVSVGGSLGGTFTILHIWDSWPARAALRLRRMPTSNW